VLATFARPRLNRKAVVRILLGLNIAADLNTDPLGTGLLAIGKQGLHVGRPVPGCWKRARSYPRR